MKDKPETWKRKSSKEVADCRVFKVREDFCERASDSAEASFFVVESPDWVNVIALTIERQVVLIEQFRHGVEEIITEIPGGIVDKGEEPIAAARRELAEETGFTSGQIISLGKTRPNPAIQNNWIHHFLALDCEKTRATNFDEHEGITTKLTALKNFEYLIESNQITHSLVIAAFYKFKFSEIDFNASAD